MPTDAVTEQEVPLPSEAEDLLLWLAASSFALAGDWQEKLTTAPGDFPPLQPNPDRVAYVKVGVQRVCG